MQCGGVVAFGRDSGLGMPGVRTPQFLDSFPRNCLAPMVCSVFICLSGIHIWSGRLWLSASLLVSVCYCVFVVSRYPGFGGYGLDLKVWNCVYVVVHLRLSGPSLSAVVCRCRSVCRVVLVCLSVWYHLAGFVLALSDNTWSGLIWFDWV